VDTGRLPPQAAARHVFDQLHHLLPLS
jgi:hypothetical protein